MNYKNIFPYLFFILFLGCAQFVSAMEIPSDLRTQQTNMIFFQACYKGNLGLVKELVEKNGIDVNAESVEKSLPLHIASIKGYIDLVKYLIEKGACVNVVVEGYTPLHIACARRNFELIKILIEKGAKVNVKSAKAVTPLHLSCEQGDLELAKYLIAQDANINAETNELITPLHVACQNGHLNVAKYLIEKGATVNVENFGKRTPLYLACQNGHLKVVEYLIAMNANVNVRTHWLATPLHSACAYRHLNIVKLLIQNKATVNCKMNSLFTPLHVAIIKGCTNIVEYLLNLFPELIDAQTVDGFTALDFAYGLQEEIIECEAIIKLFKQRGIRTISEQEAEKNMRALFAELDTEAQQEREKREQRKQKKSQKNRPNGRNKQVANQNAKNKANNNNNHNNNNVNNINQNVKPIGNNNTNDNNNNDVAVQSVAFDQSVETDVVVTNSAGQVMTDSQVTSNDNSSTNISSPVSSVSSSSELEFEKALVNTTNEKALVDTAKKQEHVIQIPSNRPVHIGQPIQNNNEYQIGYGAKLKWPRSLTGAHYNNMRDHLRKLKQWPEASGLDIKLLKGQVTRTYRLRVGGYRVLFTIDEESHRIIIGEIRLRKNVYRGL